MAVKLRQSRQNKEDRIQRQKHIHTNTDANWTVWMKRLVQIHLLHVILKNKRKKNPKKSWNLILMLFYFHGNKSWQRHIIFLWKYFWVRSFNATAARPPDEINHKQLGLAHKNRMEIYAQNELSELSSLSYKQNYPKNNALKTTTSTCLFSFINSTYHFK